MKEAICNGCSYLEVSYVAEKPKLTCNAVECTRAEDIDVIRKADIIVLRKNALHLAGLLDEEVRIEEKWIKAENKGDIVELNDLQSQVIDIYVKIADECQRLDEKKAFDEEEWLLGNIEINRRIDELNDLLSKDDE